MGILSFFVALFGGAYYIGRYSLEKAGKKDFERERNYRNILRGVITAPQKVSDMGRKIFSFNETTISAINEEIEDDIRFIFGSEWKRIFEFYDGPRNLWMDPCTQGFSNILNIAYRVWLSSKGYYYEQGECNAVNPYFSIEGVPLEQRSDIAIKTCYIIERNIQRIRHENLDDYTFFCHKYAGSSIVSWNYDYWGGEKRYLWKKENGSDLVTFDFGIPSDDEPHRFESYRIN